MGTGTARLGQGGRPKPTSEKPIAYPPLQGAMVRVGESSEVMRCPFCSYVATDREDFRKHLTEAHWDKAD